MFLPPRLRRRGGRALDTLPSGPMSAAIGAAGRRRADLLASGALERHLLPAAVGVAAGCLLGASVLAGGGAGVGALVWIGGAAITLVAVLSAAALAGLAPLPRLSRLELSSLGLLLGLVAWMGISVAWSFAPDLTWSYFNRGLAYAGLLGVGLFFGLLIPRAPTIFAAALILLVATVAVWALAGKVDPSLFEDGFRWARLREPIGLWNGLGLAFVFGVPLTLRLAGRGQRPSVRAAAAGLLFLLVPAIVLTLSRAGIVAAVLVACAWLILMAPRLEALVALAVAVPVGLAVGTWALNQPGIAEERQELAVRAADGRQFGFVLLGGFLAVAGVAYALARFERWRPPSEEWRRRATSTIGWAAAFLAIVAIVVGIVRVGDPIDYAGEKFREFSNPELLSDEASRLTSASSNARWRWWQEAAESFRDHPVAGTGAGSLPVVHRIYRDDALTVRQPHNIALQFLGELGLIGFALAAGAVVTGLVAARRAVVGLPESERPAGLAILLILSVYAVHAFVEVDWDFLALTGPVLLGAGLLLGRGQMLWPEARPLVALAPVALLALCLISLILPPLAGRSLDRSSRLLATDPEEALAAARSAEALNPLALGPPLARADAQVALGRPAAARAAYFDAVRKQPENAASWFALASFENAQGNTSAALSAYGRAVALDPQSCAALDLGVTLGVRVDGCAGPRS